MVTTKRIGIWMDYTHARLIEFTSFSFSSRIIQAQFTVDEKAISPESEDKSVNNKDFARKADYYKKISESIQNFNDVLLFGPTEAKTELMNVLKKEKLTSKMNIEVMNTDSLDDQQQQIFVRTHFTNPLRKAPTLSLSE